MPPNQDSQTTFKPSLTCIFLSARTRCIISIPNGGPCRYMYQNTFLASNVKNCSLTFSKLPLHPLSRCEHPKILSCLLHRQRSEQLSSPIHLKSVKKFYALKVFLMLLLLSEFLKKTSNTYTLFSAKCRMKNLRIVCRSQTHYFFCKILRAQNRKKI